MILSTRHCARWGAVYAWLAVQFSLHSRGSSFAAGLLTATLLIAGTLIGGRHHLWWSLATTWPRVKLDRRRTWTGALTGALIAIITAASVLGEDASTRLLAAAALGPLSVAYGAAKWGCGYWGCCDWRPLRDLPPLPYIESVVACIIGGTLSVAHYFELVPDDSILAFGLSLHIAQRGVSFVLRGSPVLGRAVLAHGLAVLTCVILLLA